MPVAHVELVGAGMDVLGEHALPYLIVAVDAAHLPVFLLLR